MAMCRRGVSIPFVTEPSSTQLGCIRHDIASSSLDPRTNYYSGILHPKILDRTSSDANWKSYDSEVSADGLLAWLPSISLVIRVALDLLLAISTGFQEILQGAALEAGVVMFHLL